MADILKAISKGDVKSLEKLITDKNKNSTISDKKKALTYACENGNLKVIQFLVETKKSDVNVSDGMSYTPLHQAVLAGKLDIVKYLVDQNADINKIGRNKSTAVFGVTNEDRLDILEYLVSQNADLTVTGSKGNLVWSAVQNKAKKCLEYLIKKKVDVNVVLTDMNPFYQAVFKYTNLNKTDERERKVWLEIMKTLQKAGADINFIALRPPNRKESPLHRAARCTDTEMIKELLKMKVDVNLKNENGDTPLHSLFYRDGKSTGSRKLIPFECIEALLKGGADPNALNKSKITPFLYMMHTYIWNSEDDLKVVKLFLERQANVNIKGFNNDTALHYAACRSTSDICELLIENKADLNALNESLETPLHSSTQLAKFKSSYKNRKYTTYKANSTTCMLLKKGAKIMKNEDGEFPHFLSNKHVSHDLHAMAEYGCDINAQSNSGDTILHCLAKNGGAKENLLEILNNNKTGQTFDLSIKNKDGKTVLDIVHHKGWIDVENELKKLDRNASQSSSKKEASGSNSKKELEKSKKEPSKSNSKNDTPKNSTKTSTSSSKGAAPPSKSQTEKKDQKTSSTTSSSIKKEATKPSTKTENKKEPNSKPSSSAKEPTKPSSSTKEPTKLSKTSDSNNNKNNQTTAALPSKDDMYDVMISYQWDHQKRALKIRDYLQKAGVKVWIDVEQMSGDIVDKMAKAVIGSRVILMCLSSKYEVSDNCQNEYKYTFKKKKPFIPVKVENAYEPTEGESLDFILGLALYYEVESDKDFDTNMPNVLKEVKTILSSS